jgi:hypothetical protein
MGKLKMYTTSQRRTYVRIPCNVLPAMTTTELTRYSLIFFAAAVTGSEGDTDGTLQRINDGNVKP